MERFKAVLRSAVTCSVPVFCVLFSLSFFASRAHAEGDLAAASAAFRQGQALQLRGDYEGAADAFLLADSIAPAPQALRGAITNLSSASQTARAVTLALEAQRRYPDDAATQRLVKRVLGDAPKLLQVHVICNEPCTVSVPGRAIFSDPRSDVQFFIEPKPTDLEVRFSTGTVAEKVEGAAGSKVELKVTAPEAEPSTLAPPVFENAPAKKEPVPPPETKPVPAPVPKEAKGLSPVYFWTGVGVTAVFGGVTLWSGLSTLSRNGDYEDHPTEAKYDLAHKRQNLTNGLIGVTALSAVATGVLAIFTRWQPSEREQRAQLGVFFDRQSAHLTVSGPLSPSW